MYDCIRGSSYTAPELITGSTGVSIESILINQARFNAAVQLGNTPTMKFDFGERYKYAQFVTKFQNTFDKTINDPSALHNLLERHVFC